jgi:hypothetical protein
MVSDQTDIQQDHQVLDDKSGAENDEDIRDLLIRNWTELNDGKPHSKN